MAERLNNQPQILEASEEVAGLPLEIADDIASIEGQFVESLEELVKSEVEDMRTELAEAPDDRTLQEKYETNYDPYKVVVGIADIAMLTSSPELFKERVELGTVKAVEEGRVEVADVVDISEYRERKAETENTPTTIYRENGLAYAQDQPETEKYAPEATKIIDALISGDFSVLGALPLDFAEALKARMESYENGVSSDEREAMISVACNGLRKKHGEELPLEGSPEAKRQDEEWERRQELAA